MANYRDHVRQLAARADFAARGRAALLCSKIEYCCEEYADALDLALDAGDAFNLVPVAIPAKYGLLPQDDFVCCVLLFALLLLMFS